MEKLEDPIFWDHLILLTFPVLFPCPLPNPLSKHSLNDSFIICSMKVPHRLTLDFGPTSLPPCISKSVFLLNGPIWLFNCPMRKNQGFPGQYVLFLLVFLSPRLVLTGFSSDFKDLFNCIWLNGPVNNYKILVMTQLSYHSHHFPFSLVVSVKECGLCCVLNSNDSNDHGSSYFFSICWYFTQVT